MNRRRAAGLFTGLFLLAATTASASSGFNESQLVVKPGHLETGFGHCDMFQSQFYFFYDSLSPKTPGALTDLWFKTGITPGMDVGVSFDPMGARMDAYLKHRLYKDYLSMSYELEAGLWNETIGRDFALQLSLLGGYPGKLLAPYGILRQRLFFLGAGGIQTGSALMLVGGVKINLLKVSSLYFEAGACMGRYSYYPLYWWGSEDILSPIAGAGVSLDLDLKEIFAPLLKPKLPPPPPTPPPDTITAPETIPPP